MTYTYYQHTIETTRHDGSTYTVYRYTTTGNWVNLYPSNGSICIKTDQITTNKQVVSLEFDVLLFGKLFTVSEEHTGRYVFPKNEFMESIKDLDESFKNSVVDWKWEDHDWMESDGNEYVIFDFGGQLELPDEDGYTRPCDVEEELPMIPWDLVNWDLSDVGNG